MWLQNKEFVWSLLFLVPGMELLNICNFLTDRNVLLFMVGPWECVWTFTNKAVHEEFLNSFRVKAGLDGKTNCAVKRLDISLTSRESTEAGDWVQSPMANDLINCAYSIKAQKDRVGRTSRLVNRRRFLENRVLRGAWRLRAPTYIPCPMHLFHLTVPGPYFIINQ